MVQVIKKKKINGEVFEYAMAFSDNEWALIQKHYPNDGMSFELATGVATGVAEPKVAKIVDLPGRAADDDKPNMNDYNALKEAGMKSFKAEDWDKAIYFFQEAFKLKSFGWLNGKIAQCRKNIKLESVIKRKV